MRSILLPLALALTVLSAGCFGGGTESTPTTPVASTPVATTPEAPPVETSPAPSTPTDPAPPTASPEPPAPDVVYEATFDFASAGDPTGQSPKTQSSRAVGEAFANVTANVTLVRSSATPTMLPVSGTVNSPAVRILDPKGQEVLVVTEEGAEESKTVPAVPGVWSIRYEGAGTLRATVTLTATG